MLYRGSLVWGLRIEIWFSSVYIISDSAKNNLDGLERVKPCFECVCVFSFQLDLMFITILY